MTTSAKTVTSNVTVACAALVTIALFAWSADFELWAFSFGFGALALLPFGSRPDGHSFDPFRPVIGLSLLLFLYSLSTLLYVSEEGISYYGEAVSSSTLITYQLACLICAGGISVGTMAATQVPPKEPRLNQFNADRERNLIYILGALVGLAMMPFIYQKFLPWNATSYADVALSLRVENLADAAAGLKETVLENIPSALVLIASNVAAFDRRLRISLRAIFGLLILMYVTTALLSGWRGNMIFAVLTTAIYFHWTVRPLRILPMAMASVAVYIIINALSVARISSDPVGMILALYEEVGDKGLSFLALRQSGELATSTNLLRLISGIEGGETSFGMGTIALNQLTAFLPRVILPDRPPVASELFVQTFYPGVFESGGGFGFFLPQDGYWDFGLPGVFVYSVLLGAGLELTFRWFVARRNNSLMTVLYAVIYAQLVLSVVRSGFLGSIKAAMLSALPILLILVIRSAIFSIGRPMHVGGEN